MVFKVLGVSIVVSTAAAFLIIKNVGFSKLRPEMVMKVSKVQSTDQLGFAMYRRFFPILKNRGRIYVFCEEAQCEHLPIWSKYLKFAKTEGVVRSVYTFKGLGQKLRSVSGIEVIEGIDVKNLDEKAWVFLPNKFRNLISLGEKDIAFYMTHFFVEKSQETDISNCEEKNNYNSIDCARLFFSRTFYRKKLSPQKMYAGMNKIKFNEFIFYIYSP